jgi:transposase-like protein/diadenosine tetraphosphatase ApaH/serine/threonine PP2A family protein phosphatase
LRQYELFVLSLLLCLKIKEIDKMNETKKCTKCGRELPIERFGKENYWCKSCCSTYNRAANGHISEENIVKIERIYKKLISERILDTEQAQIKLISPDECFVQLINHKNAWISNYGRPIEHKNGKYIFKRKSTNESGEKVCTLQKNVYDGKKWIYRRETIEIWKLVVSAFIVNFDIVGNTYCWHKDNDKSDNYYKDIYPMTKKQYEAVLERYFNGEDVTEDVIYNILNDILYKDDDWYQSKWKRSVFGVGYLGCSDADASRSNYIYSKWVNMIQRCYDEGTHKLKPYYAPCTVCEEWHNYSNYREWHYENVMGDRKVDLDKDILISDNTVYSPETCTLVTHFTNTVFETTKGIASNIVKDNATDKYETSMVILGKRTKIGTFDTEEEARQGFLDYKSDYITDFAKSSKGKVPDKTYEAMMNWVVEITE